MRIRIKGFTLLEVMIAAGILAIGFIMIAAMFPVALDQGIQKLDRQRRCLPDVRDQHRQIDRLSRHG